MGATIPMQGCRQRMGVGGRAHGKPTPGVDLMAGLEARARVMCCLIQRQARSGVAKDHAAAHTQTPHRVSQL